MNGKERIRVVITGADTATGLGTARALHGGGIWTIGLATHPDAKFCYSRYWNQLVRVADDNALFLEKLIELGQAGPDRMVLLPTADHQVKVVSDHRDELSRYYDFVYPEPAVVDLLLEKTLFHPWAQQHGFPVPVSHVVGTRAELDDVLARIRYPCVIKPFYREVLWNASVPQKVYKLTKAADLEGIGLDLFAVCRQYVVQQWIPGGDDRVYFCLFYIDRQGRELGSYTGRKILQWPPGTGSTAIGMGVVNAEVHRLAWEILSTAGSRGLCSMEFKYALEEDKYYVIEPTIGRNDLQSYLAVAGGVNLSRLALDDARHRSLGTPKSSPRRATWAEDRMAVLALIQALRARNLPWRTIRRVWSWKWAFSTFSWFDPLPTLYYLKKFVTKRLPWKVRSS